MEQDLWRLEDATAVFMAPANSVSAKQRREAEDLLIKFRHSSDGYQFGLFVLERSANDVVLFEAINVVRNIALREWRWLKNADRLSVIKSLMHFMLFKDGVAAFVKRKASVSIAALVKRMTIDDNGSYCQNFLSDIKDRLYYGSYKERWVTSLLMHSMVVEYGSFSTSTEIRLPWQDHFILKKKFQMCHLKEIFMLTTSSLQACKTSEDPAIKSICKELILIAEAILNWKFVTSSEATLSFDFDNDKEDFSPARFDMSWRDAFVGQPVLNLYFSVYKFEDDYQLQSVSLKCLAHLATLPGSEVLFTPQERFLYVRCFVAHMLDILNRNVPMHDVVGISVICQNMVKYYWPILTTNNGPADFHAFFDVLTRLSCKFGHESFNEENPGDSDTSVYIEAYDNMLVTWSDIISLCEEVHEQIFYPFMKSILDSFLKSHLYPPHGIRVQTEEHYVENIREIVEADKSIYKTRLKYIGVIALKIASYSFGTLSSIIENVSQMIYEKFSEINGYSESLIDLSENLHWLILIVTHLCTLKGDAEDYLIPEQVIQFSAEAMRKCNIDCDVTLQHIANVQSLQFDSAAEERCDPVVRLVTSVLRTCEITRRACEAHMTEHVSPLTESTLMWFLKRFVKAYIFYKPNQYSQLSTVLQTSFGVNTESGSWIINFILNKINVNLNTMSSEINVIDSTVNCLLALVSSKEKVESVAKSPSYWNLFEGVMKHEGTSIQYTAKRGLLKSFVIIGESLSTESQENYWDQIMRPLSEHAMLILSKQLSTLHNDTEKLKLMSILNCYIGIVQGSKKMATQLFANLNTILFSIPSLMRLYSDYQPISELLFTFLEVCGRSFILNLDMGKRHILFVNCVDTLNVYAKFRSTAVIQPNLDEERVEDIINILSMMQSFINSDLLSIQEEEIAEYEDKSAASVALCGLNILRTLIKTDDLKVPCLSFKYYQTISLICEAYPNKILKLDEPNLLPVLMTLESGSTKYTLDVSIFATSSIFHLASYTYRCLQGVVQYFYMQPFLKSTLTAIVSLEINSEYLMETQIAEMMYILICCYKEHYFNTVQLILFSTKNQMHGEKLKVCFTRLVEDILFNNTPLDMRRFSASFQKFVCDLLSFLLLK